MTGVSVQDERALQLVEADVVEHPLVRAAFVGRPVLGWRSRTSQLCADSGRRPSVERVKLTVMKCSFVRVWK
jgi:hypothetical protein